ncbi:glycosyltransferase family A protein [Gemmatimonas sp.]|uniref:glycosyltransferase family A protein n=1 Tax=Gemmatimonas sp. TaxID=1962908 RepID=UPI00286CBB7E|nr:glycosyltransferase family A protein [Gemmatimonas sp.]
MTLRIAVVVTCYNKGPYIALALASLAAQVVLPAEIVVVDDGSTDDSSSIADDFAARHPSLDVRVLRQANSGQPAYPRNAGIATVTSEVVICLDADDALSPLYLHAVTKAFTDDPGLGLVYPDGVAWDEEGTLRTWESHPWNPGALAQANGCPCVTAYRREVWERVGGYRTNVRGYEDWDFWVGAASHGFRGERLPYPFFNYRELGSGVFASTSAHDLKLRAAIVQNNPQWYSVVTHALATAIMADEPIEPLAEWAGTDPILQHAFITAAERAASDAIAWVDRAAQSGSLADVEQRLLTQVNSGRITIDGARRLGAILRQRGELVQGNTILLVAMGMEAQARRAADSATRTAVDASAVTPHPTSAGTRAPRVLCWMPYGQWSIHAWQEMTILHGARHRGADVRYVMCDGVFSSCDIHWNVVRPRTATSCSECTATQSRQAAGLRMPHEWLGQHISAAERDTAAQWAAAVPTDGLLAATFNGWDLGAWVVSSVHSHFRTNAVDVHTPEHEATLRANLEAGLLVAFAMDRLLRSWQPDVLFLFNGRLASLRVAFEVARAAGVRVVTHERGWVIDTLYLADNADCLSLAPMREAWTRWRAEPLTADEHARTETWLLDRAHGRNLNWRQFSPPPGTEASVRRALGLREQTPLYVLFTSSEDEVASNTERTSVFGTQARWIEATAEWARRHPDVDLVIRVHPNTGGTRSTGSNAEQLAWMQRFAATVPSNVRMVWPDDTVSSYTLMDMATVTLSYLSTTGLEAACRGRPAVMAASSYIGGYGFTHDVASTAEYDLVLDRFLEEETLDAVVQRRTLAWRFAYLSMFRYMLPFPLVPQRTFSEAGLGYTTLDALQPGRDAALDHAVDVLLDGVPVCRDPDPTIPRSADDERQRHLDASTVAPAMA